MRNYISKVNDRNLQRKRESGLTTYALCSVLLVIIYKSAEQYPTIPFKSNFWDVIYIFTCTINTLLSIVIIYSVYELTLGHLSSIRLILKSDQSKRLLEDILQLTTFLFLPVTINGLTFYYQFQYKNNSMWFFLILGLTIVIVMFFAFFIESKGRKINHSYEVFEGTGNVGTDKDPFSILFYTLGSTVIAFSVYYAFTFQTIIAKNTIVIYCTLLYFIPLILIKIIDLRRKDSFTKSLENLEYEINVKDMSDDEIRERLQKNYMGFLLSEWIAYNTKHLADFLNNVLTKKGEVKTMEQDLAKIAPNEYPIEFRGRKRKIEIEKLELKSNIEKFFNDKLNEIENVWKDSKLEPVERSKLSTLYNTFKSEFEKIHRNTTY